jgi:hypothetical protein
MKKAIEAEIRSFLRKRHMNWEKASELIEDMLYVRRAYA